MAVACSALLTCSTSTRFLTGTLFVTCRFLNQLMNASAVGLVMSMASCCDFAVPVILMYGSGPERKPPAPEKAYGLTAVTLPSMRR